MTNIDDVMTDCHLEAMCTYHVFIMPNKMLLYCICVVYCECQSNVNLHFIREWNAKTMPALPITHVW